MSRPVDLRSRDADLKQTAALNGNACFAPNPPGTLPEMQQEKSSKE
jgi:hypothetical protein